jgi:photosystem II stability/assembly factor-like uncharacterized protein
VRCLVLLGAVLALGCDDDDPCAPFAGRSCIALEVRSGPGGPTGVDQLLVSSVALGISSALTPPRARTAPVALPVRVAVLPADDAFAGTPDLDVSGLIGGQPVGRDVIGVTIAARAHAPVAAHLVASFMPDLDGAVPDFAPPDLGASDLAQPDLSRADLAPINASFHASPSGLNGGSIFGIAVDPTTPNTLYTASFGGGVFKSLDGGGTWSAINNGLTDLAITRLVFAGPNALYAAAGSSLFFTASGGNSWMKLSLAVNVDFVLIDPTMVGRVYVFSGTTVFRSTNGVDFAALGTLPQPETQVFDARVVPTNAATLYALGQTTGVFKSTDSGAHWAALNSGLFPQPFPDGLVVDPSSGNLLLTCNENVYTNAGGTSTWQQIAATGLPTVGAFGLTIDPTMASSVYAHELASGGTNGIFFSPNFGTSWSAFNTGLPEREIPVVTPDPTTSSVVYAGGRNGGVYKNVNATGWTPINNGLHGRFVVALAADPVDSTTVYAGTQGGAVFRSINNATTWSPTGAGLPQQLVTALAVDPRNHQQVYAGFDGGRGVFRSFNGGATWGALNGFPTLPFQINAIAVDPTASIAYVATFDGGVWKSSDLNAGTWVQINSGLGSSVVNDLLLNPRQPSEIYAATGAGVFHTSNAGGLWSATALTTNAQRIVMDPTNAAVLYVATGSSTQPIFKTVNGGLSWSPSATGIAEVVNAIAVEPNAPGTIYAGADSGVYQSNDFGASWSPAPFAATVAPQVRALSVEPVNGHIVYAGGFRLGGLFRSP